MQENEVAFLLRILNDAKEECVLQRFGDGSVITLKDVTYSRFMSMGLWMEYDEIKERYIVTTFDERAN